MSSIRQVSFCWITVTCTGSCSTQLLREQDDYDKVVVQLAESMGRTLGYIEDVEQFARIYQLKKCIEDVKPLMEDTTNFILIFVNMTKTGEPSR